jgi:hypothetical protein
METFVTCFLAYCCLAFWVYVFVAFNAVEVRDHWDDQQDW